MSDMLEEFFPGLDNQIRFRERHKRIVQQNADAIKGRTILDLGSNRGRWTYPLLEAGASHVVGVEGRQHLVDTANDIFSRYNVRRDYDFVRSDVLDYLSSADLRFDTVMCLGLFYHVYDHYRLLALMARCQPETIIIDSAFLRSFRNQVYIRAEDTNENANAIMRHDRQANELIGVISLGLMLQMAWNTGYNCRPIVWAKADFKTPEDVRNVVDYMSGRRFIVRLDRTGQHFDPDWREPWREALVAINPSFEGLFDAERHDRLVDARCREKPGLTIFDAGLRPGGENANGAGDTPTENLPT